MMRSNSLQTFRAALAVLALAGIICAAIGLGTANADSPANARALQLPEVLLLCQPLDSLERDRVQLGQIRNAPERNIYLYGRTDRSKTVCF
jgi:hypothetical protein